MDMGRPERYLEDYRQSLEDSFTEHLLKVVLIVLATALVLMISGYGIKYLIIFREMPIELPYLLFLASLSFVFSCILLQWYRGVDAKFSLVGGALITLVLVVLIVLMGSGITYGWLVYKVSIAADPSYIEMAQEYGMSTSDEFNFGGLFAVLGVCITISMVAYTLLRHWLVERY